jgi:hypothetical protein
MTKYFAYGSNCNPDIMEKKGVSFTKRQRAVLRGYRLLFNKKSLRARLPDRIGFANINEYGDGKVELTILLPINPLRPCAASQFLRAATSGNC